jgi:hypothetical protein
MAKKNPMQSLFGNPKVMLVGASMVPLTKELPNFGPTKEGNPTNRAGRQYVRVHRKGPKN